MPTSVTGVVFTGPRQVALEQYELLEPGPQQVLVRTTRTLVSAGTEVTSLLGEPDGAASQRRYPVRPGYSNVGVVEAVGAAVQDVRPADRVLTMGCHASHTLINLDAEQLSATAGQRAPPYLQKLPDGVGDDHAAFAILGSVALHGLRKVSVRPGESCAVAGQGVVGELLGQLAKAAGAAPVIGIDLVASRLERSLQSGLRAVVDAAREYVEAAVLGLTSGRGADVCFEATRTPHAFCMLLRIAALCGRVVVGSVHATAEIHLFEELQRKELTIIGA